MIADEADNQSVGAGPQPSQTELPSLIGPDEVFVSAAVQTNLGLDWFGISAVEDQAAERAGWQGAIDALGGCATRLSRKTLGREECEIGPMVARDCPGEQHANGRFLHGAAA